MILSPADTARLKALAERLQAYPDFDWRIAVRDTDFLALLAALEQQQQRINTAIAMLSEKHGLHCSDCDDLHCAGADVQRAAALLRGEGE